MAGEPVASPPIDDWPGRERRSPSLGSSNYLVHREITRSLEAARDRYLSAGTRVLDIGCGVQPYYPLFAGVAGGYDGQDIAPGPRVEYVSPAEALEVPTASYDLVLCTQVLEHVRRPHQVLAEFARVLAPGGYVFATTHGVYPFHPDPTDYWRWTQQGLDALFEDVEGLDLVELVPHGGSAAALAVIFNTPLRQAARALGREALAAPFIATINIVGGAIDRATPARAKAALIPNFLAVARRS